MMHRIRGSRWSAVLIGLCLIVAVVWWQRSRLIGLRVRWHWSRAEGAEDNNAARRKLVAQVHRMLLLAPPPDALVPELYDYSTLLAERVAAGGVSWNWSAYLYTAHVRDALQQRSGGTPRPTEAELQR